MDRYPQENLDKKLELALTQLAEKPIAGSIAPGVVREVQRRTNMQRTRYIIFLIAAVAGLALAFPGLVSLEALPAVTFLQDSAVSIRGGLDLLDVEVRQYLSSGSYTLAALVLAGAGALLVSLAADSG